MIWSLASRWWPAAVGVVVVLGAYQAGVNAERTRGEAATLRVQLETAQRDKVIAEQSARRVTADMDQLAAAARADGEKIEQLQEIIRNRADRGLSQPELDGLLNIR